MKRTKQESTNLRCSTPPPPFFNINVATNVAKTFLTLFDKHFPKDKRLSKIFNKNSIKISQSCLPISKCTISINNNRLLQLYLTLPLFLVGHDVGYYGPPFFPVGSNFCASVHVHSCISGDVSQPSASLPSSTAFAIYHAFCDYTL